MQITIDIPDKLGKKFNSKFKPTERKKMIKQAVEEKIKNEIKLEEDPFFKWAEKSIKCKEKDLAGNHDKYLYEQRKRNNN